MSKFLKFIVNLVGLCIILIAVALLVPPLLGVNTVMIDDSSTVTNLPIGSVTYSKNVDSADLKIGDNIVSSTGKQVYHYQIKDMDATAGSYVVSDPYDKESKEQTLSIHSKVPKIMFTVPFIAYVAMALQSTEGLIVAGLVLVFLIILFILSELWRKDGDEEEDLGYEIPDEEKSLRQLKKEARRDAKIAKAEAKEIRKKAKRGYDEDDEVDAEPLPTVSALRRMEPQETERESLKQETMDSITQGLEEAALPGDRVEAVVIPADHTEPEPQAPIPADIELLSPKAAMEEAEALQM